MRRLLVAVVIVSLVSGCGGASPGIGDAAARSLEPKIAEVRSAAEARQPETVKAKLAELRAEVETLREQGELDEAEAAQILGAAAGVEENLPLITSASTPPRPSTTPPRPATTRQPDRKGPEEKPDEEKKREEEQKKREEEQKKKEEG